MFFFLMKNSKITLFLLFKSFLLNPEMGNKDHFIYTNLTLSLLKFFACGCVFNINCTLTKHDKTVVVFWSNISYIYAFTKMTNLMFQ